MTQHPILGALWAEWQGLRRNGAVPMRSDLDPRRLGAVLENIFIIEYLAPDDIRFRLTGLRLCELMGMEVRGLSVRALMQPDHGDKLAEVLHQVMQRPGAARVTLATPDRLGADTILELLLLPMRSENGEVNRVIGAIAGGTPALALPISCRLTHFRLTAIDAAANSPVRPAGGFAESQAGFAGPNLRSIEGGSAGQTRPRISPRLRIVRDDPKD